MKRFISAAICLIMLVGTLAAPAFAAFTNSGGWNPENYHSLDEVKTFKLGDLDDDGNVALKDLLAIRKHIVDKTVEVNTSAADVIADGKVNAARVCGMGGIADGIFKMALGNRIGAKLTGEFADEFYFKRLGCAIIVEADELP